MQRITSASIDLVKSASITQVIGHYIKLKRSGVNNTASCPFHNEKSASFTVNEVKGIYKCFGCGAGGDAIRFVMEHEHKDFIQAIETIAHITGTVLEYEERQQTEKEKAALTAAEAQEAALNLVVPIYREQLFNLPEDHPVKAYLAGRGFTAEVIAEWQLGWAGTDWHFITPVLIEKNLYEAATRLGLVRRTKDNEKNYDGYRSRITIPIIDRLGRYVGLAGRFQQVDLHDAGKEFPKYINPADCELYNKSTVLFGLNKAAKAIKEQKQAVVVEGNFDVITPHQFGFEHVVGISGTAFTPQQMALLKKHTGSVVLMLDNDEAGKAASNRALPELLKHGFKVDIAAYQGKDPDEFFNSKFKIQNEKLDSEDALLHRCRQLTEDAADDIHRKAEAKTIILELIASIQNEIVRGNYLDTITAKYKWNKTETKAQYQKIAESTEVSPTGGDLEGASDDPIKLPDWVSEDQKEEFMEKGYLPISRKDKKGRPVHGYWSFTQNGKSEITNFTCAPLFHVYAGVESRYLLQINNGYRAAVLDVPAKSIISIDQFAAITATEGNFIIFGGKPQWLRIASDLLQKFPRCIELKSLGWQTWGFWAWVDKIFVPGQGLKELDRWGIYEQKVNSELSIGNNSPLTIDHSPAGTNFLIPASCEAYRQLQHTGEDPFENDRHLAYMKAPTSFSIWAAQMQRVYHQAGVMGVAGIFLSLFRDVVFSIDNNCPHLYAFGEPSSGKSKWAESITALFFHKRSAFNLNSGTDFAFFGYMQRYKNTPAHLNEFDIEVIKPEWFQAIKGVYDGEGRERGKGGSKNRTEVMKVHSVLLLTGQKLVTADDNSVVTRSLIEGFSKAEAWTEADSQAYNQLKDWEAKGLSSLLVELLSHRETIADNWKAEFNSLLSAWRKGGADGVTLSSSKGSSDGPDSSLNQRILQNWAHLATGYRLFSALLALPQSAEDFTTWCYKQAHRWSNFIRSSDTLSEFWRQLEFLVDQQLVHEGWDYIIEEVTSLKIRKNRTDEVDHPFEQPTKVLYLRLNSVHKLFQVSYRQRTGKEAMNMENLLHYFGSRKYFLGAVKMKTFKRYITINKEGATGGVYTDKKPEFNRSSCYAFVYHETGVEIERGGGEDGEGSAGVTLSMSKGSSDGYYAASSTHDETDEIPFPIMKKS